MHKSFLKEPYCQVAAFILSAGDGCARRWKFRRPLSFLVSLLLGLSALLVLVLVLGEKFTQFARFLLVVGCRLSLYRTYSKEGRTFESGSSSSFGVYSQFLVVSLIFPEFWCWNTLFKKLSQVLETSGVDLSKANISVGLDLGKGSRTVLHLLQSYILSITKDIEYNNVEPNTVS
ncbi:LOW QUALITY PROTEIN: hypothetical protein Cgig2_001113 [Carnegiea gigantea]|uniref:Uncharacterized protein n=1 Tax=Carnegiea gigantea TaxID=171969 RepID=A0A9Q1JIN2_9CARY|nr:LOW QUALITY PROTEIN: hypothetical protein Cgig2_001113 [Carnegiea gigantea]